MKRGSRGKETFLPCEFREDTQRYSHTYAEKTEEIRLEPELMLLWFLALRMQRLTLSGWKSRGFVIYNQFSARFICTCLSFFFVLQFIFCPQRLLQHSSVLLVQSFSNLSMAASILLARLETWSVSQQCKKRELCSWFPDRDPQDLRPIKMSSHGPKPVSYLKTGCRQWKLVIHCNQLFAG